MAWRSNHRRGLLLLGVLTAAAAVAGCASTEATGPSTESSDASEATPSSALFDAACAGTLQIDDSGSVTSPEVVEASGIAASRRNPGLWWVNNDSGDSARFFGVDATGRLRAVEVVDNASAVDWEDIAVGPPTDPTGGATVYLADIGDNNSERTSVQIYRVPEPAVAPDATGATAHVSADRLTFTYPDGAHDAEALIVDPASGDLIIVTKDWSMAGQSAAYRAAPALAAGTTTVLEKVADLALPAGALVTGGDVTSDGALVALRSYGSAMLFSRAEGEPLWSAFATTRCEGPTPIERQGESIGFTVDGGSYVTVSEGPQPTLHLTHR